MKILRRSLARDTVGMRDSHFHDIQNPKSENFDPTFPNPVLIGKRATGYFEHELDLWLQNRPRVTRKHQDTLQENQNKKKLP
ncbi:MAG: AlpA family phage regulatory protein [Gammaproteobacteria bacterium]|nr:AlpA family phage regulatory protein [Gammaproteobacteria bacterium]